MVVCDKEFVNQKTIVLSLSIVIFSLTPRHDISEFTLIYVTRLYGTEDRVDKHARNDNTVPSKPRNCSGSDMF